MKYEGKLLGYYNYTVVLTYIGMLAGFIGIVRAFDGEPLGAIICLMIAGFCDMFDGTVASTKKDRTTSERSFGIQIDSLSDLICFGILPASLVYSVSDGNKISLCVCSMYVLCGLIRLAYFNVDEQERQQNSSDSREFYYGMPVTLAALFVPIVYGACDLLSRESSLALVVALLVMAVLFILPFRLKKPKTIGKVVFLLLGFVEIALVAFASSHPSM